MPIFHNAFWPLIFGDMVEVSRRPFPPIQIPALFDVYMLAFSFVPEPTEGVPSIGRDFDPSLKADFPRCRWLFFCPHKISKERGAPINDLKWCRVN